MLLHVQVFGISASSVQMINFNSRHNCLDQMLTKIFFTWKARLNKIMVNDLIVQHCQQDITMTTPKIYV